MTAISFNSKALARNVDSKWYHAGGRIMWLPTSFTGVPSSSGWGGNEVWTDGTDIYCASGVASVTYKLDKNTKTWSQVNVGFSWATTLGYSVFHDGNITYACLNGGTYPQVYVFDTSTKTFTTHYQQDYQTHAADIWYNGGDIYHSMNTGVVGDPAHNLKWNRSTHKWEVVSMSCNPSMSGPYGLLGNAVWNYKGNSYVGDWDNDGNFLRLYKFNHSTSTWNETSWNGFCAVKGIDIWTDYDGNMIYSDGTVQYKINTSNNTWEPYNRWYLMPSPCSGRYVWSDGDEIYWSVNNANVSPKNYVLVR